MPRTEQPQPRTRWVRESNRAEYEGIALPNGYTIQFGAKLGMTMAEARAKFGQPSNIDTASRWQTTYSYDAIDPAAETYNLVFNSNGQLYYGVNEKGVTSLNFWRIGGDSPDSITGASGRSIGNLFDRDLTGKDVQSIGVGMTSDEVFHRLGQPYEHNPISSSLSNVIPWAEMDIYKAVRPAGGEYRVYYGCGSTENAPIKVTYAASDTITVNWAIGTPPSVAP